MIKLIEKYPITSLLLCVVIMLGFTIDAVPVSIMEARNFISAREMLTDHNWVLTTMNGEPRYQKPPLPTWITALFGHLFGITSVLALRWPALLMVAITGIFGYKLCKKLTKNIAISTIAGFIIVTSFYVIGITIEGPWDIYAHSFMLLALYQLLVMLHNNNISFKASAVFALCIGASVLSKGPVSLYVLFLSYIIAYGMAYGYKLYKLQYLKLLLALVLGITIGASWYLYVRIADPETFTKIALKETSNWGSYNVRPFYYYWSFFTQTGIWTIPAFISLLYPYMKSRVIHLKAYRFSFFWTVIAVILLSVIPEKKSRYLMPVLIPLALNMSFYIYYLIKEFKSLKTKKETLPVYFNFGLIALIAIAIPFVGFVFFKDWVSCNIYRFVLLSITTLCIGVLLVVHLKRKAIKSIFYLIILFIISIGFLGLPLVKLKTQIDYNPISEWKDENKKVYVLGNLSPEMLYNYGDKIPPLTDAMPSSSEFYVLSDKKELTNTAELSKRYSIQFIQTFDINTVNKDQRGYKQRLVNYLFKLSRK